MVASSRIATVLFAAGASAAAIRRRQLDAYWATSNFDKQCDGEACVATFNLVSPGGYVSGAPGFEVSCETVLGATWTPCKNLDGSGPSSDSFVLAKWDTMEDDTDALAFSNIYLRQEDGLYYNAEATASLTPADYGTYLVTVASVEPASLQAAATTAAGPQVVQSFSRPGVAQTAVPTQVPEIAETDAPDAPEVSQTAVPDVAETVAPEVAQTDVPEVTQTDVPEVTQTDAPEVAQTDVPEVSQTEDAEVAATPIPSEAFDGPPPAGENIPASDGSDVVTDDDSDLAATATAPVPGAVETADPTAAPEDGAVETAEPTAVVSEPAVETADPTADAPAVIATAAPTSEPDFTASENQGDGA